MVRLAFVIAIVLLPFISSAQQGVDADEMVGFGCYAEGSQTKPVLRFNKLIRKNNYKVIAALLTSTNNAERYLAVISLEKLSEAGKYHLSNYETQLIQKSDHLMTRSPFVPGVRFLQRSN